MLSQEYSAQVDVTTKYLPPDCLNSWMIFLLALTQSKFIVDYQKTPGLVTHAVCTIISGLNSPKFKDTVEFSKSILRQK